MLSFLTCFALRRVGRSVGPLQSSKHSVFSPSGSLAGRATCSFLRLRGSPSRHCAVSRVFARVSVLSPWGKRENLIAVGERPAVLSLEVVKVGTWEKKRNLMVTG